METFTRNQLRNEANPHFVEYPLPHHISSAHVRRTEAGTWAITLVGKMHPKSNMPPARDRLYIDGKLPEPDAVRKACERVGEKFTVREEGSNLVHYAREVMPSITDRQYIQDVADNLFGDWIYRDPKATKTVAFGLDLTASGTWSKLQYAAYLRQAKINMEAI